MIGFALFAAAALAYEGVDRDSLPFTELFFEANKLVPELFHTQRQMVCLDTFPEDGCETHVLQSVHCERTDIEDWNSWRCTGTPKNALTADKRLELGVIAITCTALSHQSCHIKYTMRAKEEAKESLKREERSKMCTEMCSHEISLERVILWLTWFAIALAAFLCIFFFEFGANDEMMWLKARTMHTANKENCAAGEMKKN